MTIYPIIVTYNGLKWIDQCLGSLRTSTLPLHTIVVDNASTDGTPDYIAANFPEVELIRSTDNLGFGKGNNIGLQKALDDGADYVFLLNQDAWVKPDTIEKLVQVHQKHPEYGILSPVHLNWEGSHLDWFYLQCITQNNCPNYISDLYFHRQSAIYQCNFIHAACWLLPHNTLLRVGLFDPIFPHYGEDNNYVNRTIYSNLKIGIVTNSVVQHDGRYKDDKETEWNLKLKTTHILVELTNPLKKLSSTIVVLLKNLIFSFINIFFFKSFRHFLFNTKATFYALKQLKGIRLARKSYSELLNKQ